MAYRIAAAALVLASLPLAGCGSSDAGPGSAEDARAEAKRLGRPLPGKYRQTIRVTSIDMPGIPAEMLAQMKSTVGQVQEAEFCYSKAMAEQGFTNLFQYRNIIEGAACSYDRFAVSGGKLDAALSCRSGAGAGYTGDARFSLSGNVWPEVSVITAKVEEHDADWPDKTIEIGMVVVSERLGDCPAQ